MIHDDVWSGHVANGEAFVGEAIQVAAGGMIAHTQIFNPVGSGVRARLRYFEPIPIFGIGINSNPRRHDVALTSNAPFAPPHNLLGSGGASPLVQLRNDSLVVAVGSPFWLMLSAGSNREDYPVRSSDWGHDLLPGQGLVLQSGVGGFSLVGFMWVEVSL